MPPPAIPPEAEGSFSGPETRYVFAGFLLDLDGTIVDSTDAIEKHWRMLGAELGFDAEELLRTSHGRRSIDTLKILVPEKANWDYVREVEGRIPTELAAHAHPIPGAPEFLAALTGAGAPWAIVTSGSSALCAGWLRALRLPLPPAQVVAEDVAVGKPDPEAYRLGRARIGLGPDASAGGDAAGAGSSRAEATGGTPEGTNSQIEAVDCKPGAATSDSSSAAEPAESAEPPVLVVEDSPSGVRAGKAAGCRVLALATTHALASLRDAGADWVVRDLAGVRLGARVGPGGAGTAGDGGSGTGGACGWELHIADAWVPCQAGA